MKGWKTAALALGVVVMGGLQSFFSTVEMDPKTQGYILMGIGTAIAGLRAMTDTPIFSDGSETE